MTLTLLFFLFTAFQSLMCPVLIDERDPRCKEGGEEIEWNVFPKKFKVPVIKEWKEKSDAVKRSIEDWNSHQYGHVCMYCCLFGANAKSVYKSPSELKSHSESKSHEKAKEKIESIPEAKYFHTFLENSKPATQEEINRYSANESRQTRKKPKIYYGE